jgi:hypothetical protein
LKPNGSLETAKQAEQYDERTKRGASGPAVLRVKIGVLEPAPSAIWIDLVERIPLERIG